MSRIAILAGRLLTAVPATAGEACVPIRARDSVHGWRAPFAPARPR